MLGAVIWNVLIIISILAAYRYSKKVGIVFSIFWVIETFIKLNSELFVIQLIIINIFKMY